MNWTTVQDNTGHVQSAGLDRQPNPLGLSCPVVQAEKERDDAAFSKLTTGAGSSAPCSMLAPIHGSRGEWAAAIKVPREYRYGWLKSSPSSERHEP
jgi:hypothetical protein